MLTDFYRQDTNCTGAQTRLSYAHSIYV